MYLKVSVAKYPKGKLLTLKLKGKDICKYEFYDDSRSKEKEELRVVAHLCCAKQTDILSISLKYRLIIFYPRRLTPPYPWKARQRKK